VQATKRFRAWELAHLPQPHRLPIFALSANVRAAAPCGSEDYCTWHLKLLGRSALVQVFEEKQCECADAGMDGTCCARCACAAVLCADEAASAFSGFMQKPLRLDALRQVLATRFV
jgi:hypothetical protein